MNLNKFKSTTNYEISIAVRLDRFVLLSVILFIVTHLITIESSVPDDSCDAAIHLSRSNYSVLSHSATFATKWPPSAPKCLWTISGDENCSIDISCKINIPRNSTFQDCYGDYVKVTDGSEGELRFCGKMEVEGLRASDGLRDLFVVLEADKDKKDNNLTTGQEVTCFVKCGDGKAITKLPKNLKRKWEFSCICGLQNKPVKIEQVVDADEMIPRYRRIVGGVDAVMNEFPWQVALVYKGTRKPFCGGSLITDNLVLTAGHCFQNENYTTDKIDVLIHAHTLDLTVQDNGTVVDTGPDDVNVTKLKDDFESTIRLVALEWIVHPLFTFDHLDFDIALLKISPAISLEAPTSSTPICLPKATTWDSLIPSLIGKNLTASGWGRSSENATETTAKLQKLEDIPYIPLEQCQESMDPERRYRWNHRLICAGYLAGGKDTCGGDSGGALKLLKDKNSQQYLQIGIVSWGEGCARNDTVGFYTRVTEHMQWVHFHSGEAGSKWCLEEKGYQ